MKAFLLDIVDILASYFFDRSVQLDSMDMPSDSAQNDLQLFHSELNLRHDIAYSRSLMLFFDEITKSISTRSKKFKTESALPLRGELDINRYLRKRNGCIVDQRFYPVTRTVSLPNTPENILIKSTMVLLIKHLTKYKLKQTAELVAVQQLLNWLHTKLSSWPWDSVSVSNNIERTYLESKRRVLKRQTGNNLGYMKFLSWFEDWRVLYYKPTQSQLDNFLPHLLAFPTGDSFNEKVFEIWCMKFLVKTMEDIGFEIIFGPKPLYNKQETPIYTLRREETITHIWFQKQAPLGKPQWVYTDTNQNLRGIPDIILTCEYFTAPLVVDAKLRSYSRSNSEEIYKMLGYYENFRKSLGESPFFGVLLFVSDEHKTRELHNPDGCSINILSVPDDIYSKELLQSMSHVIESWLSNR